MKNSRPYDHNQSYRRPYTSNYSKPEYTESEQLDYIISVMSGERNMSPMQIMKAMDKQYNNILKWLISYRDTKYEELLNRVAAASPTEPQCEPIVEISYPEPDEKSSDAAKPGHVKFLPCACGFNRRHLTQTKNSVTYDCPRCGRSVTGTNKAEAKFKWNALMTEDDVDFNTVDNPMWRAQS